MPYQGRSYNIPVTFWILDTHPTHAPMAYVCPTPDMQIRVSRHVDQNGKVYLPYLHEWGANSDLLGLIQLCIITFSEEPPVYARQTPVAHTPVVSSNTPYPPTSASNPGAIGPSYARGQSNGSSNSNTITSEHIKASLLSAVEDDIKRLLREEFTTAQVR